MKKVYLGLAVLVAGLLFGCTNVNATDNNYMPEAGFYEFIDEIEPEVSEMHEHETFSEPIEPVYDLTDREVDLLLRIGVLEGGGEDPKSIANVMQVVLNRVESDRFPNTVEEVIFQENPRQFCTADVLATANITPQAYEALDEVIFGDFESNDCHFFESCSGQSFSSWAKYAFSYGGHDFYKVAG